MKKRFSLVKICKNCSLLVGLSGFLIIASEVKSQEPLQILIISLIGLTILLGGAYLYKSFEQIEGLRVEAQ